MVRVEVHNFQSIADGVVDIDGFSVVVGRSNIGKSALVRAIKAALTGAPADSYVRHGSDCQRIVKGTKTCKCFCSVHIHAPDLDLLWEKGDSVNRYVHNGTEHTVVGKGTPEFLGAEFAPLLIGGDTTPTLLQVADQFRPLFILDRSGTAVADVLSDVAKLDQINEASRAAERDRRECSSTRKVRDKDLRDLDHTIALYDGLDVVLARVKAVEAIDETVTVLDAKLKTAERLATALASVASAIRAFAPIEKLEIRSPVDVTECSRKLGALTRWRDSLEGKLTAATALENLVALPIPAVAEISFQARAHFRLERWTAQLVAMKALFTKFKAVEAALVPEVTQLGNLYASYRTLHGWSERVSGIESSVLLLQKAKTRAEAEETAVLAEFKALEVCPTCRQPIQFSGHPHMEPAYA